MARRKKRKVEETPEPAPAGEARTSLRGLLKDVVVSEPEKDEKPAPVVRRAPKKAQKKKETPPPAAGRPSDTLRGDDRIAWYDAFAGVRPLSDKERARAAAPVTPPRDAPQPQASDDEARSRLAALVGGGVRFDIMRDGDEVRGRRVGTPESVVRTLMRNDARPEATVDLHGMRAVEAEREVVRFVRGAARRGVRRVCIVHGKGLHSESGPVLRERVVHVLSEGGAAPVVLAFVTASHARGGSGALMVELTR